MKLPGGHKYRAICTDCNAGHSHPSKGLRGDRRYQPRVGGLQVPLAVSQGRATALLPWPPVKEYLDLFYAEGRTTSEIAALYGCATVTLRQIRKRMGIASDRERLSLANRFWVKVRQTESGCWEWLGARSGVNGYGLFSVRLPNHHRTAKAHRISWELANNASLLPGALIMHSCDNPGCVNPAHLELGTHKENARQAFERNRRNIKRGSENPKARMTPDKVREARERFKTGEGVTALARAFGISYSGMFNILRGNSWAWLS